MTKISLAQIEEITASDIKDLSVGTTVIVANIKQAIWDADTKADVTYVDAAISRLSLVIAEV